MRVLAKQLYLFEFVGFNTKLVSDQDMRREFEVDKKTGCMSNIKILPEKITFEVFRVTAIMKYIVLIDSGQGLFCPNCKKEMIPYKEVINMFDLKKQLN